MPADRDELLTVEEAAAWLKVTPNTVYEWIKRDELPVLRLGRLIRIPKAEVLEMIGQHKEGKAPDEG